MNYYAIIVAGGIGSRMKSDVPKQFMNLAGKPVIIHTISKFLRWNSNVKVIVVVHQDYLSHWGRLKKKYFSFSDIDEAVGGETRFQSVKNGLKLVKGQGLVAVHDAARPLVSTEVISACFSKAQESGNAIPIWSLSESLRYVDGDTSKSVNRKEFVSVQTPQVFESTELVNAYGLDYKDSFTDDASVFEASGKKINLVSGNRENIKITEPSDFPIAEAIMSSIA